MKATIAVLAGAMISAGALAQQQNYEYEPELFSELDAELMSVVWDEIRDTRSFEQIDWEDIGLAGAPGNWEAQRLMEENWDQLRRAARFDDIDWGRQARSSNRVSNRDASRGGFDWLDESRTEGPFTEREAELMSRVWPEIRAAESFDQINWQGFGLQGPPGDREARRIMEENWGNLRQARNFDDIDWEASTNIRESRSGSQGGWR